MGTVGTVRLRDCTCGLHAQQAAGPAKISVGPDDKGHDFVATTKIKLETLGPAPVGRPDQPAPFRGTDACGAVGLTGWRRGPSAGYLGAARVIEMAVNNLQLFIVMRVWMLITWRP